jgi:hypothetical protein
MLQRPEPGRGGVGFGPGVGLGWGKSFPLDRPGHRFQESCGWDS